MKLSSASGRTDQPTQTMPRPRPRGKSKKKVKYGKAPQAPKRFKSAYMFFSTTMHPEIRLRLGQKGTKEKTTDIAKLVSIEWKGLSQEERVIWEEKARQDKIRYEMEKKAYDGPWKVEINKKEPSMPQPPMPMSPFLDFATRNRSTIKSCNPRFKSKDVMRVLASMWKEAQEEEHVLFMDREKNLQVQEKYRSKMKVRNERAGGEAEVTEQVVPQAEMRADEIALLDPADNHPEKQAVQQSNEAHEASASAADAAEIDHLIDAYYMNNAINHITAEVGTRADEATIPLVTYPYPYHNEEASSYNEETAAQQQYKYHTHQQQQEAFAIFHDPNDNVKFEPNTLFYHKYTAAEQLGSFNLHSGSSGPGSLMTLSTKNNDPEMRQLYQDLAMIVCEN